MARLAGEFNCDLPLDAAGSACVAAMRTLDWNLESVEPEHIVFYVNGTQDSPMIEILLRSEGEETVLRIVGSDSHPGIDAAGDTTLVATLDQARFAIEAQIEEGEPESGHELRTVPPGEEPETEPQPATQRRILQSRVAANGGSLTMHASELATEFGFPGLSPSAMEAVGALLRTVGIKCSPPLDQLTPDGTVTLVDKRTAATGGTEEGPEPHAEPEPDPKPGQRPAPPSVPTPRTNRLAKASLILSILWIGGVGSMLAILLGGIAQDQIDGSAGWETGRDLATAGIVIGALGALLTIILAVALFSP
jgi:hypothetical protein